MNESKGKGLIERLFGGKREQVRLQTADEIQAWLVVALARRLSLPVEQIEVTRPFAQYGLDSRSAVSLAGELEEVIGRELSPMLTWDYPTIEALANYLASGASGPD